MLFFDNNAMDLVRLDESIDNNGEAEEDPVVNIIVSTSHVPQDTVLLIIEFSRFNIWEQFAKGFNMYAKCYNINCQIYDPKGEKKIVVPFGFGPFVSNGIGHLPANCPMCKGVILCEFVGLLACKHIIIEKST